jgi:hypothetical protein
MSIMWAADDIGNATAHTGRGAHAHHQHLSALLGRFGRHARCGIGRLGNRFGYALSNVLCAIGAVLSHLAGFVDGFLSRLACRVDIGLTGSGRVIRCPLHGFRRFGCF